MLARIIFYSLLSVVICGCGNRMSSTQYTYKYFLKGTAISNQAVLAGNPNVINELDKWMVGREFYTGMFYGRGLWDKEKNKELVSRQYAYSRLPLPVQDYDGLVNTNMAVSLMVQQVTGTYSLSWPKEIGPELTLDSMTGTFSISEARSVLDEVVGVKNRNSESNKQLVINWISTGSYLGVPYTVEFEQVTYAIGEYLARYESDNPVSFGQGIGYGRGLVAIKP